MVCVYVSDMWRPEDSFQEPGLTFHLGCEDDVGDGYQAYMSCSNPCSHFPGPSSISQIYDGCFGARTEAFLHLSPQQSWALGMEQG